MFSLLPLSRDVLAASMKLDDYFDQTAAALSRLDPSGTAQYEQSDEIVYEFNLGGYDKNNIKVSIDKSAQLLKIKASPPSYPNRKYYYNSLNKQDLTYVVGLASGRSGKYGLDLDRSTTTYADGLLRVVIPKASKDEGRSEITLEIN